MKLAWPIEKNLSCGKSVDMQILKIAYQILVNNFLNIYEDLKSVA